MVTLLLASITFLIGMFWGWMRGDQAGWMRGQHDTFKKFTRAMEHANEITELTDQEPPV